MYLNAGGFSPECVEARRIRCVSQWDCKRDHQVLILQQSTPNVKPGSEIFVPKKATKQRGYRAVDFGLYNWPGIT
jgi:hypothetical protein